MNREQAINMTEEFVRRRMKDFDSGHDWWHIARVKKIAAYINEQESLADPFILEIAALIHDTVDSKFFKDNIESEYEMVGEFLESIGLTDNKDQILGIIRNVSFSNSNRKGNLNDPVLLILQDADKLDAIGAIGIARAFNYGGFKNNPIYIPDEKPSGKSKSTVGHFYDKLLILKDMMNTPTGKRIAEERHMVLEKFLEQFYKEWKFGTGLE
jgi:uncharacterized protein